MAAHLKVESQGGGNLSVMKQGQVSGREHLRGS